jgi:hypothetical protein
LSRRKVKAIGISCFSVLAIAAALVYVIAPPTSVEGYRERAAATAETLDSQVETALLWATTREEDKATAAATLVGFEEAEADASAAATKFESYNVPREAIGLRTRLVALATEVRNALAELRIAAEQERWKEVGALSSPLPGLSDELAAFEEKAEP